MIQRWSGPLRRGLAAWMLLVCWLGCGVARAQSTEAEIKARLVGKELYLRGFWMANKLDFNSNGDLKQRPSEVTSFTLSGMDVGKVSLKNGQLKITGTRRCLEMKESRMQRMTFSIGKIEITVDAPANGDFGPALDKIFVEGLESVKPLLPAYWQDLAKRDFVPLVVSKGHPLPTMEVAGVSLKEIGGHVLPPKVLKSEPPSFSSVASVLRAEEKVFISLVVGANGKLLAYRLDGAGGLGLDERALESVTSYVWQPATEDGVPVAVQLQIEVDFWTKD